MGKDSQYVRIGIQKGILKFGTAMRMGDSREYSYYCPDKRVWEETGYFNRWWAEPAAAAGGCTKYHPPDGR